MSENLTANSLESLIADHAVDPDISSDPLDEIFIDNPVDVFDTTPVTDHDDEHQSTDDELLLTAHTEGSSMHPAGILELHWSVTSSISGDEGDSQLRAALKASLKQAEDEATADRRMMEKALQASLDENHGQTATTSTANQVVSNEAVGNDPTRSCMICFEGYSSTHRFSCIPCGHMFGETCITNWLTDGERRYCPTCNTPSTANNVIVLHEGR